MPSRVFTTGIIAVAAVSLLVFSVEFFIPLAAKNRLDTRCRNALLAMESAGGLTESIADWLKESLVKDGFENVTVSGSQNARQGDRLNLTVRADYKYDKLTAWLTRKQVVQQMGYYRTAISRRVVN